MKKILFVLFFICTYQLLLATTITSVKCSNWTDASSWDLNRIPISSDTIVIDSFVYFDTDFTSESPGVLIINSGGSLCGNKTYTGQFLFEGFCYTKTITLNYGKSISKGYLHIKNRMTVIPNASLYSENKGTCVGCSYSCENCTANKIEQVDSTEITNELNQTKIDSLNSININFLATNFSNIDISIFPNPSALFFNIAGITKNTSISLYNNLGKLLFKTAAENDVLINTEGLSNGTYILLLERDFFKQYKKIVVLN